MIIRYAFIEFAFQQFTKTNETAKSLTIKKPVLFQKPAYRSTILCPL